MVKVAYFNILKKIIFSYEGFTYEGFPYEGFTYEGFCSCFQFVGGLLVG